MLRNLVQLFAVVTHRVIDYVLTIDRINPVNIINVYAETQRARAVT